MQRRAATNLPLDTTADDIGTATSELNLLRDVLRLLPTGVTVQDAGKARPGISAKGAAPDIGVAEK